MYSSASSASGSSASTSSISSSASSLASLSNLVRRSFSDNRVDSLVLLLVGPTFAESSGFFLLGVATGAAASTAVGRRARSSIAPLETTKVSTTSLIAQFPLNFDSWSVARHKGHFPSVFRALRMQREQKVWEQEVMTGELKKSLQTWHRSDCSTCMRLAKGVPNQSVGSDTS